LTIQGLICFRFQGSSLTIQGLICFRFQGSNLTIEGLGSHLAHLL